MEKIGTFIRSHCEEVSTKRPELTRWANNKPTPGHAPSHSRNQPLKQDTERRKAMEIPPRKTPPKGESIGKRRSSASSSRPNTGPKLATRPPSMSGNQENSRHRRIFFIGGERIHRIATAARKSVPNPNFSKSPYAFVIEELSQDHVRPNMATMEEWFRWLTSKIVTKGDLVIIDALTSAAWLDYGYTDDDLALEEPHGKNPSLTPLEHNPDLKEAADCISHLAQKIHLPMIFFVVGPMPRYLHGPCCGDAGHMQDWNNDTPEEILSNLNKVDSELKAFFNPRANIAYFTARKLAESALSSKLVTLKPIEGSDQNGTNPLKIWQQLTTPGNQYMTAQGGKLIWSEAISHCTDERFLAALEEVYLHLGYHPHETETELELYEKNLRKICFGRDELGMLNIKQEPQPGTPMDLDNVEIIDLE